MLKLHVKLKLKLYNQSHFFNSLSFKFLKIYYISIHIYIFEIDPGGSVPAWFVNMFADKGPYETFKQLAETLKK